MVAHELAIYDLVALELEHDDGPRGVPRSDGLEALNRETVLDVGTVAEAVNECRRRSGL